MSNSGSDHLASNVKRNLRRASRHALNREWDHADACFQAAIESDVSPVSQIAHASSLAERERYHEALCLFTGAIDRATATGNREALGVIFHNLAGIYRELGDADLARRFQQRALLQLDDCGPAELLGLANDAWLSKRTELASCLAESCVELDEETEFIVDLEAQATVSILSGQFDNPRDGIRSIIKIYRQHCSRYELRFAGIDLMNLAALFAQIGWVRTEMHLIRRAIGHFDSAPAPVSAFRSRQVLAYLERIESISRFDPSRN